LGLGFRFGIGNLIGGDAGTVDRTAHKTPVIILSFFIARQHACACRARYCYGESVRPSVCHTLVLYRNECTYRQTLSVTKLQGEFPHMGR